jgi:hypothetical protein
LPRHYVPRNDGVICVIARPQAVAIHAFGSHGLPRFARNDSQAAMTSPTPSLRGAPAPVPSLRGASATWQSMSPDFVDCRGLRPRNDGYLTRHCEARQRQYRHCEERQRRGNPCPLTPWLATL